MAPPNPTQAPDEERTIFPFVDSSVPLYYRLATTLPDSVISRCSSNHKRSIWSINASFDALPRFEVSIADPRVTPLIPASVRGFSA